MKYKWSLFNFVVFSENYVLIQNTLNGATVKMEKHIFNKINTAINSNNFFGLSNDEVLTIQSLEEEELVVNFEENEAENYISLLRNDFNNDKLLSITIATTYKCNFNCPYCFESGINRNNNFRLDDIIKIENYVDNYLSNNAIERVNLFLFGGEPTLNWNFTEKLIEKLENIFSKYDINYTISITSNGYLLDNKKALFLYNHNWKSAEITLDGPQETHDLRRFTVKSEPTFSRIYNNIKNILNNNYLKKVNIRINISNDNYDYISELLYKLKEDFSCERINISLGLITDTIKDSSAHNFISNVQFGDDWSHKFIYLYDILLQLGYETIPFYSLDGYCLAKQKHGFIICPDKKIYRCLSMIGRENCVEDSLDSPNYEVRSYINYELIRNCLKNNCPFVPLCLSGCCFQSFVEYGTREQIYCRKNQYNAINSEILKRLYL